MEQGFEDIMHFDPVYHLYSKTIDILLLKHIDV